jgi:hypothetical protein
MKMNALQVAQYCLDNWNGRDADTIAATFADGEPNSDPAWGQGLSGEALANSPEEGDLNTNRGPNLKARQKYFAVAALAFAVVQVCTDLAANAQSLSKGQGDLRVMTYNVDEGTDFIEIGQANTTGQFLIAVGQTITQVRATNPPQRMQAVAKQIIAAAPALVSLQEVDKWSSGPWDPLTQTFYPGAIEFDMLQELLAALKAQGGHYIVAVEATQYNFPQTPGLILPSTYLWVQVIDQNVILARTDLDPSIFQWNNPQFAQFANIVVLTTPIGPVPLPRVWSSVDVTFNGSKFRYINTHLESSDLTVRELQGAELRAGPAYTSLPVVVAMDSNAQASPLPKDQTYVDFINAGYKDAWTEIFPSAPGYTCCQAQLVNNTMSQLYQRIDLILTLGSVEAQNIALFGAVPSAKTPTGLWPSDHAGVAAQLVVESQ